MITKFFKKKYLIIISPKINKNKLNTLYFLAVQ